MWSLLLGAVDIMFFARRVADDRRREIWKRKQFMMVMLFAALETALVLLPLAVSAKFGEDSFLWLFGGGMLVALLNFVWFIPLMRRIS